MSLGGAAADWRSSRAYADLLRCDRRAFAWEWVRRTSRYRKMWRLRERLGDDAPALFGLLAWVDPALPASQARPIWSSRIDPNVLDEHPASQTPAPGEALDIRDLAPFVSVEIDPDDKEHWLLSNGYWSIRLDLHDGTLLGGPQPLEHRLTGMQSAQPKLGALKLLLALAAKGRMPASLLPHERRAARWIFELRTGDALLDGARHQEIARTLFGDAISATKWRPENPSYRLRVQRLVHSARSHLADPLGGPWFR